MHIKPQNAMFLFNPGKDGSHGTLAVGSSELRGNGLYSDWNSSLGACFSAWREMDDEQIYQAMTWLALEICEFSDVPMKVIRNQMEENVIGYREYCNRVGRLALGKSSMFGGF
jgi:hypothetical protein